jgi:hypothetical protein
MDPAIMIAEARQKLREGHSKDAAYLLTEAIYDTHDPQLIGEIRELANEGRAGAGRFGRGRWDEILRLVEVRTESVERKSRAASG